MTTYPSMKTKPTYIIILVVSIPMAEVIIPKVLVDTGSTLNVLFTNTLKWIDIPVDFL